MSRLLYVCQSALNVDGGVANLSDKVTLKDDGSSYSQSGGVVNAAGEMKFEKDTIGTISGGQLNVNDNLVIEDDVSLTISGGGLYVAGDTGIDNGTITQTGGAVVLNGDLDITGSGVYDLTAGSLQVNGAINVSNANGFLWGAGGTLGAHPSDSTIEFDGNLDFGAGTATIGPFRSLKNLSGPARADSSGHSWDRSLPGK